MLAILNEILFRCTKKISGKLDQDIRPSLMRSAFQQTQNNTQTTISTITCHVGVREPSAYVCLLMQNLRDSVIYVSRM